VYFFPAEAAEGEDGRHGRRQEGPGGAAEEVALAVVHPELDEGVEPAVLWLAAGPDSP